MSDSRFDDEMSVGEARKLSRVLRVKEDGHICPVCERKAVVQRRSISETTAKDMIRIWLEANTNWAYLPDVRLGGKQNREEPKLRYWGLIEEQIKKGHDGMWRLTREGVKWVNNTTRVQKYALVYNGECLGVTGEFVAITNIIGPGEYRVLMGLE